MIPAMLRCTVLLTRPPMTILDFILADLAIGAALALFAVVRLLRHEASLGHLRQEALDSGLPVWGAALLLTVVMLYVALGYAVFWPTRWREALR